MQGLLLRGFAPCITLITQGIINTMDFLKNKDRRFKNEARKQFGERLRTMIITSPFNQAQVAEMLGIEPPNVSRWVNGENYPSKEHYEKLKEILKCTDEDFEPLVAPPPQTQAKADLLTQLYSILPTLNETQLRQHLKLAEVHARGVAPIESALVGDHDRDRAKRLK